MEGITQVTDKDLIKIGHIAKTFDFNFKLTRLYASYLENAPDIITAEMMSALTEDGDISPECAFCALLCEIFGIDADRSPDDRRMIREYITPSIRRLDPKNYEENPYYKNIVIPEVTDGSWELKRESYKPYRGVIAHDMIMKEDYREIPPLGFFEREFSFPAVLEDSNEWMTLTPVDLDTCEEAIERAEGRVVTFGLGLGYYAYMVSQKDNVESITVVERSAQVIKLFEKYILPQFPNKDKVHIVNSDAFEYAERVMPDERFDLAFVDTWRDASDGAPMYRKMKALEGLSPNTHFMYWIENFLVSRIRAERFVSLMTEIELGSPAAPSCYEEFLSLLDDPLRS